MLQCNNHYKIISYQTFEFSRIYCARHKFLSELEQRSGSIASICPYFFHGQKTYQFHLCTYTVTTICTHSFYFNAASHICIQPIVVGINFNIHVSIFLIEERCHKCIACNYSCDMPQLSNHHEM